MIQNLYMGNGCLTKQQLKIGCLEFQVAILIDGFHAWIDGRDFHPIHQKTPS